MQLRVRRPPRALQPKYPPIPRGEAAELAEWRRAAWTMFWLLLVGKVLIMIALAIVAFSQLQTAQRGWSVIFLLNWSWVLFFGILVIGPVLYWLRLSRVRRRRAALIYSEWNVD